MLSTASPIDRETTFAVCYCGHLLLGGDACETCGYVTPAERERRTYDLFAEWRSAAQAHITKRRRQAQGRRLRRRRTKSSDQPTRGGRR